MSDPAVWKALADDTRRGLLDQLRDGPRTTGQLCAGSELSRFGVMKHLEVLVDAGLVTVARSGRERWNHLNPIPLRQAYERWMRPYADRQAEQLLRLKDAAEKGHAMETAESVRITTMEVRSEVRVAAPREKVWDALTRMGEWFPHYFREGSRKVLEPHLGGHFYEDWGDGGAITATVTRLEPLEALTLTGPMGARGPVLGTIAYTLEADGDETIVRVHHRAIGDLADEAQATYTEGWQEVLGSLVEFIAG